jgi:eukaryotic-like serine/threonine-protein kinase
MASRHPDMRLIKQLGEGGFGIVDLVMDSGGEKFARKTLSITQNLPNDMVENVRKRFIREAKVQQGFGHRNIVPVIGGNLEGDKPYYFMPVAASSLADDLEKDRTCNGDFISVVGDIVAALDELHGVGIFHRDLKPQNVLRFQDGETSFYAVSDFGFISQKDSTLSKLTTTGMAKGSDYFTAPEITADLRRASAQSDIFSLGCILHEMVGAKDRIPCQEIKEDGDYGQILLGCTRADPTRRFRSVRAVLDALVSIDPKAPALQNDQAKEFAEVLEKPGPMTAAVWTSFVEFVEDNLITEDAKALLRKLSSERIQEVCDQLPDTAGRLAVTYSEWVTSSGFNFDACDGIADRLQFFISSCPVGAKVECLMALLLMGTSHNRWYVERKFLHLCSTSLEESVAKRLAIEFRASDDKVCRAISHLELSIQVSRTSLHPLLSHTLDEICS